MKGLVFCILVCFGGFVTACDNCRAPVRTVVRTAVKAPVWVVQNKPVRTYLHNNQPVRKVVRGVVRVPVLVVQNKPVRTFIVNKKPVRSAVVGVGKLFGKGVVAVNKVRPVRRVLNWLLVY